jgi:hypothetical protein
MVDRHYRRSLTERLFLLNFAIVKKLLLFLLLSVYGFSSTGMSLHLHYCCGKLNEIFFQPVKPKKCAGEPKMAHSSCCDFMELDFRIHDDQKSVAAFVPQQAPASVVEGIERFEPVHFNTILSTPSATNWPPGFSRPYLHLYCNYRI